MVLKHLYLSDADSSFDTKCSWKMNMHNLFLNIFLILVYTKEAKYFLSEGSISLGAFNLYTPAA